MKCRLCIYYFVELNRGTPTDLPLKCKTYQYKTNYLYCYIDR